MKLTPQQRIETQLEISKYKLKLKDLKELEEHYISMINRMRDLLDD